MNCASLKSVNIPNGVTVIYSGAFANCSSLESVTIPSSVTEIEHDAFKNCSSLTEITIPKSVTAMGSNVFRGCSKITINVESVSRPSGWDNSWNPNNRPIVWGYTED